MTFTTLTFFIFLVIVFVLYWRARTRGGQNMVMLIASYFFYGWWDARFCGLMLWASLLDFVLALAIQRSASQEMRKALLITCLISNLGLLGFFKYFNFFAESFVELAHALGMSVDPITLRIILPVGISFYTFQTMSYTIDVYQRRLVATSNLTAYLAYVSSFPQLVAGPIERGTAFLPQFLRKRTFHHADAAEGCRQILWGLFKKLVVADTLSSVVQDVYDHMGTATGPMIAMATLCFAFQIYCDFAAYSDIAIGTGKLFGLQLMRNFAYPYFSQSPAEFWRRWHISLSTWFRDYVYVPLGGRTESRWRMARNIMLTFVISGLWHGASWNFVIWGFIMGLAVLPEALSTQAVRRVRTQTPGGEGAWPEARALRGMALTFALVCLGWVFFRAATLADAGTALRRMVGEAFSGRAWAALGAMFAHDASTRSAAVLMVVIVVVEWIQRRHMHPLHLASLPRWQRWAAYTALLWLVLLTGPREDSRFIYFQF